jgi:hypothetical protein
VVFWLGGERIAGAFSLDPEVRYEATLYATALAFTQLFVAYEALYEGVLSGAGATRQVFWLSAPLNLLRIPPGLAVRLPPRPRLHGGVVGDQPDLGAQDRAQVVGGAARRLARRWSCAESLGAGVTVRGASEAHEPARAEAAGRGRAAAVVFVVAAAGVAAGVGRRASVQVSSVETTPPSWP